MENLEDREYVYSVENNGQRPKEVAVAFARSYWEEPRKIRKFERVDPVNKWEHREWSFQIVRGVRTYFMFEIPSDGHTHPDQFRVAVERTKASNASAFDSK